MTKSIETPENRVRLLAQTIPSLLNAPGIRPWQAIAVDDWAASGGPSHGELCSARFILTVWNPDETWRSGRFDVMEALSVWDVLDRQAFLESVTNS